MGKVNKEELIKACSKAFLKCGYYGTSMADLGEACGGVEKSHFYYYFKSKDALFLEVLNYLKTESLTYIFSEEEDTNNPKEFLSSITNKTYQYYTTNELGCIFGKTALEVSFLNNDFFNESISDYFTTWHKKLSKIYKEYHKKKTSKELAQLSIQDLQGALIMQQLHKDNEYVKKSLDRMFERITD